ncbi:NAD(+) diphosphatase [Modestobacter sp. I12A-02628]|uniref:NAD(+) diphosphatase n=1 Tax=Goekera deserti TaxID=2497753 RepID=A0A7K3W841_9ACTN|nr:NAD(+) diphosphatase [Goekera deserti]MPQ99851.1 NAD(+) diphosphatase [Goekera deserti]NDI50009.1 NAD(+) diphosphatase [Goekera deserti]NEL52514.1 NAD(+) diphosphatase [Goekera deserti]
MTSAGAPPAGSGAHPPPAGQPVTERDWPTGSRASEPGVPVLSRVAHDRGHLARSLPDPTGGRPVRVLTLDATRAAPVHEGAGGPELLWDEQPTMPTGAVYLGEADGVPYAVVRGERSLTVSGRPVDGWSGLRDIGADLGDRDAGLLAQAVGIVEWHERNRFSPATGAATVVEQGGWVQRDPVGGGQVFPRTDPAVIMLVHDGDRCVLGRQAVWPPGRFSILAGFVEPGESAEAAVVREVAEEVGLRVTDVRYVSSQPWPFPQSLMLGFTARVEGDRTLRVDEDEIEEARWFTREELAAGRGPQALPPPVSIARFIIDRWVAGDLWGAGS